MADNQVTLEINVDAKDAQKAIDQFGASAIKAVKSTEKSISSLSSAFTPLAAGITAGIATAVGAFKTFDRAIEESIQTAKELKQIKFSLQATGEASGEAVQGIVDFSNAVKNATSVDDNLVRQLFVQAKAFGISTDQAKKLTQAAIDLAAATGMDVETALRQLGGTLDGSAGKINNLGVEFRNLSTEQLKNGDAIDLVNRKYGGAGAASLNTYEGATNTLSNAFGDLFENIGNIITQSDGVIKAVQVTANAINKSAELVNTVSGFFTAANRGNDADAKKFAELTRKNIDQIELIGNKSDAAVPKVKNLVEAINQTGGASSVKGFETFGQTLENISAQSAKSVGLTGRAAEEARKKFDDLLKSIQNAGESEIAIADRVRQERQAILDKAIKDGVGSQAEYAKSRIKIEKDFQDTVEKVRNKALEDSIKSNEKAAEAYKGSFEKLKNSLEQINSENDKKLKSEKELINIEYERQTQLIESAKKELELTGKTSEEAQNIIDKYKEVLTIKKQLATSGFIEFTPGFKSGVIDAFGDAGREAVSILEGVNLKDAVVGAISAINSALSSSDQKSRFNSIGTIIGTVFDKFLPGIGAVLGQFLGLLSNQSKEQVRESIKAYIDAVPDFVDAVAENLPAIAEGLVDVFSNPKFWERAAMAWIKLVSSFYLRINYELAKGIGKAIGFSIDEAFQKVVSGFIKFGESFTGMFDSFGEVLSNIFKNIGPQFAESIRGLLANIGGPFGDALRKVTEPFLQGLNGLKSVFKPLIDAVNAVKEAFEKASGTFGKGGGSGIIAETGERIGKALGFARGGIVPQYAATGMVARGTDTVPAMLTPGEMVVPRDMVGQLGSYLNDNGSGGKNEAILMAILQVIQQPVNIHSEVKVNQSAFADIMLQLSRQNARTAA